MQKIKILGISPYKGMDEILQELAREQDNVDMDGYVADRECALELVDRLPTENYDVIISRGGTATLLKKHVDIPVIDSGISSLDVLRAIKLAQNFSEDFWIIGYENITTHAKLLGELMEYSIPIFTIENAAQAEAKLTELKEEGIRIVVCDVIASQIASRIGLNSVLISSGYESIQGALKQAVDLAGVYASYRKDAGQLSAAFMNSPLKCVVFDSSGTIVQNSLRQDDASHEIIRYLEHSFRAMWESDETDVEKKLETAVLNLHLHKQYLKGRPCLFVYVSVLPSFRKSNGIEIYSREDMPEKDMGYYSSSHSVGNIMEILDKYSQSGSPVVIIGEEGTGKDRAALYIHTRGNEQNRLYYLMDCGRITEKEWSFLYHHSESPLMKVKHTLYFKQINALSQEDFSTLIQFIKDTCLWKRNRLIFSLVSCTETSRQESKITAVFNSISSLLLKLPALRERADDIPRLATLYINQLNTSLKRQIVGFEPKALTAMHNFRWYGNLSQFKRVIRELMLLTTSSYISYENTRRILHQETFFHTDEGTESVYHLNIGNTLDDITFDIARMVLKQENGSQTRTARRLGISRTTLWRILKSHEQ